MSYITSLGSDVLSSSLADSESWPIVKESDKPIATKVILGHTAPCWHCNKRLQACNKDGTLTGIGKYGCSPNYKGCAIAFVTKIDGYDRRLHGSCAEQLGFKLER